MVVILKLFKWRHLPNLKSECAETWWEAFEQHEDSELLKSFRSDIQDGHHGSQFEILQTIFAPDRLDGLSLWDAL